MSESEKVDQTKVEQFLSAVLDRRWDRVSISCLAACLALGAALWPERAKIGVPTVAAVAIWTCVFLALLIWSIRSAQNKRLAIAGPNFDSAIRPLASFEERDADLFKELGREREVRNLFQAVTNPNFRIGYLIGESGAGKTSLLKAGLIPALKEAKCGVRLVEFSNADPLSAIIESVAAEENAQGLTFLEALAWLAQSDPRSVLILDQFEQWFIHNKRSEDRAPFLAALGEWYRSPSDIRILISIREDFAGRLTEIQAALGYDLTIQNNQYLRRLNVRDATDILEAICTRERIRFSRGFVERQLAQEVADRQDGLISPFDLQILAYAVSSAPEGRTSGFTAGDFRSAGGVDGLIYYYVRRQLQALEGGHQANERRTAAIAVLRVLSDVESGAGLGCLSGEEIVNRLVPGQPELVVRWALEWLSGRDVRLIVPGPAGFRLVHDKLVEAVSRLVTESGGEAERANSLLNQRVKEYLANGRSSRFLLPAREWRLVVRNQALLEWGDREAEKRELLQASRAKTYAAWALTLGCLLTASAAWGLWAESSWVLRWRIKEDVIGLEAQFRDRHLSEVPHIEVAHNLMTAGYRKEALDILRTVGTSPKAGGNTDEDVGDLLEFASALVEVDDRKSALVLIGNAQKLAEGIQDQARRIAVLGRIASAQAQAGEFGKALSNFKFAVGVSADLGESSRSESLRDLARAMVRVGNQQHTEFFALAEDTADKIQTWHTVEVLLDAAAASARWGDNYRSLELIRKAERAAGALSLPDQADMYVEIAKALTNVGETPGAMLAFHRAEEIVNSAGPDERSVRLRNIAESMARVVHNQDSPFLPESRRVAERIPRTDDQSKAFREIAFALALCGHKVDAIGLFERANALGTGMIGSGRKPATLQDVDRETRMVTAVYRMGDQAKAGELLEAIRREVDKAPDAGVRAGALRLVGRGFAQIGLLDNCISALTDAVEAASRIKDQDARSAALREVVISMAETGGTLTSSRKFKGPDWFKRVRERADDIQFGPDQSQALRELAVAMAAAGDLAGAVKVGQADRDRRRVAVNLSAILAAGRKVSPLTSEVRVVRIGQDF